MKYIRNIYVWEWIAGLRNAIRAVYVFILLIEAGALQYARLGIIVLNGSFLARKNRG